ncbi:MAG: hypothetical protein WC467_02695 [Patescibacteria group bacterium]
MFPEQLKKILNLIKKTGDRVVVFDAQANESYVIMDFARYEGMLSGEGGAVAVPETAPEAKPSETEKTEIKAENLDLAPEKENLTEEDLTDKINREISLWKNRDNSPYPAEEDKPKKAWTIPTQVKDKAQEIE